MPTKRADVANGLMTRFTWLFWLCQVWVRIKGKSLCVYVDFGSVWMPVDESFSNVDFSVYIDTQTGVGVLACVVCAGNRHEKLANDASKTDKERKSGAGACFDGPAFFLGHTRFATSSGRLSIYIYASRFSARVHACLNLLLFTQDRP